MGNGSTGNGSAGDPTAHGPISHGPTGRRPRGIRLRGVGRDLGRTDLARPVRRRQFDQIHQIGDEIQVHLVGRRSW